VGSRLRLRLETSPRLLLTHQPRRRSSRPAVGSGASATRVLLSLADEHLHLEPSGPPSRGTRARSGRRGRRAAPARPQRRACRAKRVCGRRRRDTRATRRAGPPAMVLGLRSDCSTPIGVTRSARISWPHSAPSSDDSGASQVAAVAASQLSGPRSARGPCDCCKATERGSLPTRMRWPLCARWGSAERAAGRARDACTFVKAALCFRLV